MKFGLSKSERIKSKNEFDLVFSEGTTLISNSRILKAIFYIYTSENAACKVAFAVFRRAGNAAWRNRVRRVLRDIYRNNKHIILERLSNKTVLIVFSLNSVSKNKNPEISSNFFRNDVLELLNKIKQRL